MDRFNSIPMDPDCIIARAVRSSTTRADLATYPNALACSKEGCNLFGREVSARGVACLAVDMSAELAPDCVIAYSDDRVVETDI